MDSHARMAAIIRYLDQHFREQPSLEKLASLAQLSVPHFHREFQRWTGISPKGFVQGLTHEYAKAILKTGASVMETAYSVGLSGPSRLHDLCLSVEAVTPGTLKNGGEGMSIRFGTAKSPLGPCFFAESQRGICRLEFLTDSAIEAERALQQDWPQAKLTPADERASAIVAQMFPTASPTSPQTPLRLWLKGTRFQLQVWKALIQLPSGSLISYQELGTLLNRPRGARAIGNAVASNPIAVLIPCHRVIRSTGLVQGYRWGTGRKRALIAWENGRLPANE